MEFPIAMIEGSDGIKKQDHRGRHALVLIVMVISLFCSVFANPLMGTSAPADFLDDLEWSVQIDFDEPSGKTDWILFGEALNASDGVDNFDAPNPPNGPEPFIDAYFTTFFPEPHNRLLSDIRIYPNTYQRWNFSTWWTGSDTTVTMTWNFTDILASEYKVMMLCDGWGTPLADMLQNNSYDYFIPSDGIEHFQIIAKTNIPPVYPNPPLPANGSTNVERPPSELSLLVEDPNGDMMDIYLLWRNHTGEWFTLSSFFDCTNGTYSYYPPFEHRWIWGNTTYTWSVRVTDGKEWTNATFHFSTSGSRYDVNNDERVNFQDAGLVWIHRTAEAPYDGLFDVNQDQVVNFQDAGQTWTHRD
jgi:hypothetical protein